MGTLRMVMRSAMVAAAVMVGPVQAGDMTLLDRLQETDAAAVNAVVMYPEAMRNLIFEASTHPGALIRIRNLQAKTRNEFTSMIEKLPEDDQKKLWELSRYPELVAVIGSESTQSDKILQEALNRHPEAIHSVVREFSGKKRKYVVDLRELNDAADVAFRALMTSYPDDEASVFSELIQYPEILDILTKHIDLTAELGDLYRRDPDKIVAGAEKLQLELARQAADADQAWADTLKSNPQAMAELEAAAGNYVSENKRADYVYTPSPPSDDRPRVTVNVYPYPYWYGAPVWVGPYWYPRPYWYHTGFYVSPGGTVIIVGTPSYHYTHWYFYGHHHHVHYGHLSYHYARHYDLHRHHRHGAADAIREWERDNKDRLPGDWAGRRENGRQYFEEVGRSGERQALATGDRRQTLDGGERKPNRERGDRKIESLDRSKLADRQRAGDFHDRAWGERSARRTGSRGRR